MAREAPEDPWCGLAAPEELAHGLGRRGARPRRSGADADAGGAAGGGAGGRGGGAGGARASARWTRPAPAGRRAGSHLAATNGFSGGYGRTGHSIQAVAICGEGTAMERDYAFESRAHRADLPDPEAIGRLAGERAVGDGRRRASRRPAPFRCSSTSGSPSGLIGHLVQAINGTAIARGASWLKDALGERVLPAGIDLIEDPLRPRIAGSRPFDGEGLPVARRRAGRGRRAAGLDARPRHRRGSSGCRAPATPAAAPRRRRARPPATWR